MLYQVVSFNQWLYPDDVVGENSRKKAELWLPRNGFASFQVLLNECPVGEKITCSFSGNGRFFSEFYRAVDVNVTMNTGVHGFTADYETAKSYVTRKAPFRVYDALEPIGDITANKATEVIYVCYKADACALPGAFVSQVTISVGSTQVNVPVTIRITDTLLPDESLYITNWFSLESMARSHGKPLWSEAHWTLIEQYGKAMRRARQNVFWVTWDTVIASVDEQNEYIFDFSRTERLIRLYLAMGFTVIEGSPICHRDNWDAVTFKVKTPSGIFEAMSEQGYLYMTRLLQSWRHFLQKNGWYEKLIQHVGDEPHDLCAAEYQMLSGIIRKHLPAVSLIEAVETYALKGAVDIWVPKNDYYTRHKDEFTKLKANGDRIWFYTCCIPGGFYMNRLLDMPLLRTRYLHWGNYKYQLEGFLHWGLNHWRDGQDPFEESCPLNGPVNHLPAGDSHMIYPGKNGPMISLRLEQMRAGAEDYELLKQLAAKDESGANALVAECFVAFDQCEADAETFDITHGKLLKTLMRP